MEVVRKIFAFPFLVVFAFLFAAFFLLVNAKLTILSPDKIKTLADGAGIYSQISGSIRESLIADDTKALNEGNFFEELSRSVGANSVKYSADKLIEDFFSLNYKAPMLQVIFPDKKFYTKSINQSMYNEIFTVPGDIVFAVNNFSKILLAIGVLVIIFLIIFFLISSGIASVRLVWLGLAFIFSSLIMLVLALGAIFYAPDLVEKRLMVLGFDAKMLAASIKMLNLLNIKINLYFYIELAITFLLGLAFIGLGTSQKKQRIGIDLK